MRTSRATATDAERVIDGLTFSLRSTLRALGDTLPEGLLSISVRADNLDLAPHLPATARAHYWSRQSSGHSYTGLGVAASIRCSGADRLEVLTDEFSALGTRWQHYGPAGRPDPVAFIGFAFSPNETPGAMWHDMANTELVVPELLFRESGDQRWLIFSADVGGRTNPVDLELHWASLLETLCKAPVERHEEGMPPLTMRRIEDRGWQAPIAQALMDIRSGSLEKVVLTRRVKYSTSRRLRWGKVLQALAAGHEDCARFAVTRPGFALLGVSPERLLSLDNGMVIADALAGTAPRGERSGEDRKLAQQLLADPKALEEHTIVVNQIREALAPSCSGLVVPPAPGIMSLPKVHHLWSPLRGRLRNGSSLLDLAGRLHPTPAVGGSPRDAALNWLKDNEKGGRGWYTGAYGWLDASGNGELSVVLRCSIVNDTSAELFAGAGIVADSVADQELAETEWKLRTMRGALELG